MSDSIDRAIASAQEAAHDWVRSQLDAIGATRIDWLVVCGSGIGGGIEAAPSQGGLGFDPIARVDLGTLGLPTPSVAGHGKALVLAKMPTKRGTEGAAGSERVVLLQTGRVHPYEGHDVRLCTAALAGALGTRPGPGAIVLTAAVGALSTTLRAGDITVMRDQIALFGPTPLRGGQFVDCSNLFDKAMRRRIADIGHDTGEPLPEAVYFHARGPQYESPAECEAARRLGGDIVGMSTTYEAILAAAHNVPCCGFGVVANAAGEDGLTHEDVERRTAAARGRLATLLRALLATDPTGARVLA